VHKKRREPQFKKPTIDLSRFSVVSNNRGSERGDMLDKFLVRIEEVRQANGFSKLGIKRLASMLAHIPTDQLYPFYQDCERAKSFTAYFHWSLKAQNRAKSVPSDAQENS
jgi:hypothetical protein